MEIINPNTVKVGMGATLIGYSDTHAYEVLEIKGKGNRIVIRRMKAERDPSWKPEFSPGGFAGHCSNQSEQRWNISSDPNGSIASANWSKKHQTWKCNGQKVHVTTSPGREFYDYNF